MRYGRNVPNGFLPVFSVDTEKEAERLLTYACQRNLYGEFLARELMEKQTLTNLQKFSDRLAQTWLLQNINPKQRLNRCLKP